jgi:hypothetical protein
MRVMARCTPADKFTLVQVRGWVGGGCCFCFMILKAFEAGVKTTLSIYG